MAQLNPAVVTERVTKIIRRSLPKRAAAMALTPELKLRADLNIDSMGLMSIAFRVEEEFGIDVASHAEAMGRIQTIGDVVQFIQGVTS
jgi:acyl carrier protein